jgi:hypothetical protein
MQHLLAWRNYVEDQRLVQRYVINDKENFYLEFGNVFEYFLVFNERRAILNRGAKRKDHTHEKFKRGFLTKFTKELNKTVESKFYFKEKKTKLK